MTIRIGTRGSDLALAQARMTRGALAGIHGSHHDEFEIVVFTTTGDRIRDRALLEAGGKGLFVKEIEEALLDERIDIAVHSAKDVPTWLPEGLMLGACLEREDPRDALIANGRTWADLPKGGRFGTASLRRQALARRLRPDLQVELLRGNVPTRLGRVTAGDFDATLLAYAGLRRLGLDGQIDEVLPFDLFPPAPGQGTVTIECRCDDEAIRTLLSAIDHRETSIALTCERAFLAALDGSCRTPIAAYATVSGEHVELKGIALLPDGSESYESEGRGAVGEAEAVGRTAGAALRGRASAAFLRALGIGQ